MTVDDPALSKLRKEIVKTETDMRFLRLIAAFTVFAIILSAIYVFSILLNSPNIDEIYGADRIILIAVVFALGASSSVFLHSMLTLRALLAKWQDLSSRT